MFLGGEFVRNVLLSMCYDGTNYHGWQIQKNALTVQEVFQNALLKILNEDVDIKGCSRTDSGVHANMYCISVKINSNIPCERLKMAMNRFLPKDIAIKNVAEVLWIFMLDILAEERNIFTKYGINKLEILFCMDEPSIIGIRLMLEN